MGPKVSIGIPFYNPGKWFQQALQSVLAQTFDDWELLLVDDGSTDGSLELAQRVNDPRVTVVSDGINQSLAPRLNQIAQLAHGEYLARMDADDMMHPERIARQAAFLDENAPVDVVGSAAVIIDRTGNPTGIRGLDSLPTRPRDVLQRGIFMHPTIMGRLSWFQVNPYSPQRIRTEDRELWCRTFTSSRFAKLRDPLYFYREGPEVNVSAYAQACRDNRRILLEYGPPLVGWPATGGLMAANEARIWVYQVASALALQQHLVRRRSMAIGEGLRATTIEQLSIISTTRIRGLE